MDIVQIKDTLYQYQHNGNWNEAILYITDLQCTCNDIEIDTLFVAELYWLLVEKDFIKTNDPELYSSICWNFAECFVEVFDKIQKRNRNNFFFQWFGSILIDINPEPFFIGFSAREIKIIGLEMMNTASQLSIPANIQNLFTFTENVFYDNKCDDFDPCILKNEVEEIHFRKNNSDNNMKNHLLTTINMVYRC